MTSKKYTIIEKRIMIPPVLQLSLFLNQNRYNLLIYDYRKTLSSKLKQYGIVLTKPNNIFNEPVFISKC